MPSAKPTRRNPPAPPAVKRNPDLLIYLLLAGLVFAIYSQVLHFDFVTYDDPDYVTTNTHVHAGLTIESIQWALTSGYANNSFPLTWISHMVDWDLFGPDSGWHHFTNVWIHALSTLLLFALLKRMTRARWRSALVAFLFGLHPLHVESVAWVAERKDVLSGLFLVLTLWGYAAYAERPGAARYVLTLFLFCLGLMAKPMLVTLPVLLLLLDRWPLRRGTRLVEKIPFLALSIAASLVAYFAQRNQGATVSVDAIPVLLRLENSVVSYGVYILKTLWPVDLGVFYPYPVQSLMVPALIAGVILAAITALVIRAFPRQPSLAIGWFWYVVTLLPVIGLIQIGVQARADRYTYIPMIGLALALIWGGAEVLGRWPAARVALASAVCCACLILTWVQVQYWRDSISLYRHTISVVPDSYLIRYNLAVILESRGDLAEAADQLRETIRTRPAYATAHATLGQLLAKEGHPEEGLPELQTAVRQRPDLADAHLGLGTVLAALGRSDGAIGEFSQAIRLEPENANAHYNLGIALAQKGNLPEAAREFTVTVQLAPEDVDARFNLGVSLAKLGQFDEAIDQLSRVVQLKPGFTEARRVLDDVINLKRR
jgi:protein O-mannosyl-transferase